MKEASARQMFSWGVGGKRHEKIYGRIFDQQALGWTKNTGWCLGRWAGAKHGGEKDGLRLNLLSNDSALKGSQQKNAIIRAEPSEVQLYRIQTGEQPKCLCSFFPLRNMSRWD